MNQTSWMRIGVLFLTVLAYSQVSVAANTMAKPKRNTRSHQPTTVEPSRNVEISKQGKSLKMVVNARQHSLERTSREGSGARSAELLSSTSGEAKPLSNHVAVRSLFSEEEFLQHFGEKKQRKARSLEISHHGRRPKDKTKTSKPSAAHKPSKGCRRDKKHRKLCEVSKAAVHEGKKKAMRHSLHEKPKKGHPRRIKRDASRPGKIGIVDIFGLSKTSEKPRRKPVIFTDFVTDEVIHVQPKYKL